MAVVVGLFMGPIGSAKLSSIVPSSLGFEVFLYIFAFFWWFTLSYALVLFLIEFQSDPPNKRLQRFWLMFSLIMVAMIIVANGYVPHAKRVANKAVDNYLSGKMSQSEFEASGYSRSRIFRSNVMHELYYDPQKLSEDQVRFLYQKGFNVFHCAACPREILDHALESKQGGIDSIAENPNMTKEDFHKLAKMGHYQSLIMSPHTDEAGYEMLQSLILDEIKANDTDEYKVCNLKDMLKYLERERARRAVPIKQP